MRIRTTVLVFAITAVFSVGAMGQSIFGKQWRLTELNGRKIDNTKAYLEIAASESRMSGNTGCNRMFGAVTVKRNNRVTFNRIGATRMFCSGEAGIVESEFTRALESVKRYAATSRTLDLYSGNKRLLRFTAAVKAPDAPVSGVGLGDRKWMLETMNGRDTSDAGKKAFVVFDPSKGSVGGDTSCNAYGGTLKVNGRRIAITEVISTMRACVEDERMDIERGFLDLLKDADNYRIEGDRLTLFAGARKLMTFRGVAKP